MYYVYALKSVSRNYIYVSITDNLERRLNQHNSGYNRSTKPYLPFKMFYHEQFPDRIQARIKEKELKSRSGKRYLNKILKGIIE